MIGWIDERLDLLSLPPSLTTENLDRALKVGSLSERFTPSDQQLYAQHVIPTLVRYFHAVYASETVEWRADNIRKAVKQPTFFVANALYQCIPPQHRPTLELPEPDKPIHPWRRYYHTLLLTLDALLSSSTIFSLDPTIRDAVAVDLSDVLVKQELCVIRFPSLAAYFRRKNRHVAESVHTLTVHLDVLSEEARTKVKENLAVIANLSKDHSL